MLTIKKFTKGYGELSILNIEELVLSRGVHWFKGSNGSGKTTLFKSLSGIIPCEGDISLGDGTNLRDQPIAYRRRVNYSEAEPLYPGFLTPIEMMQFVGTAKQAKVAQQQDLFSRFGINAFQHKSFSTCSSGMIKKLSLSLAFLGTPEVIILDEPLITLDDAARNTLIELINQYIAVYGTTCLISSHQELEELSLSFAGSYLIQNGVLTAL